MKPAIGITTYFVKYGESNKPQIRGLPGQDMMMSTMDYCQCIKNAGGLPVPLPVIDDEEYLNEIVERMDGFLISGGVDVYPVNFGSSVKKGLGMVNPERDEFELKLLKKVLELKKPVLGICRGFQLMNVFFGGTLCQDINSEIETELEHFGKMLPKYSPCHKVILSEESKLYSLFGKKELLVNSFHHQAINKLGLGLKACGWSEDGLVEVIEHKEQPFVLGVQWHPEMMAEKNIEQQKVFNMFIEECKGCY